MANDEHLSVLLQGPQQWNRWRDANPEVKPDLRQADLHEAELSGVNLSYAALIGADLHQACLQGANLEGANLRHADLRGTNLRNADLHQAILAKTDLRDAHLNGADIREADLREARLPGADLAGADLKGAVLHKAGFEYVSLHTDCLPSGHPHGGAGPAARSRPALAYLTAKPAPAATRKLALAAALTLALGVVGFLVLRPADPVDARVSQAVAAAVGKTSGVDSVQLEGQALILRSGRQTIESGMYLDLLKTACRVLEEMESASGLREIRIVNQSGQEGWVYEAPEQCATILTKPPALTALSIAAHTRPIRKQ